jgi:hypothetical protein
MERANTKKRCIDKPVAQATDLRGSAAQGDPPLGRIELSEGSFLRSALKSQEACQIQGRRIS